MCYIQIVYNLKSFTDLKFLNIFKINCVIYNKSFYYIEVDWPFQKPWRIVGKSKLNKKQKPWQEISFGWLLMVPTVIIDD